MSTTPEQRARRRRTGGILLSIGVFGVLFSTWAVPMGIINVSWALSEEAPIPMDAGAWFTAISGPIALIVGGVLAIVGFQLIRIHSEARSAEDIDLDEQWGEDALVEFDPARFTPGHRSARELEEHDRWG